MTTARLKSTPFRLAVTLALALTLLVLSRPGTAKTTIHHLAIEVTVAADGTYVQTFHEETTASTTVEAQAEAQVPLAFNPSLETLDVLDAYTLKPDGTRKDVDAGAIKSQLPPAVRTAPMFSDVQEKVVIFPDLAANDTRVLTFRRRVEHPLFPGQFTWWEDFPRNQAWEDVAIRISAPASYELHAESIDVPHETSREGERTIYAWRYSAKAVPAEHYAVAPIDRRPRFFVSSFPDYDAMAAAWRALAEPKEAVTPAIRAKADEITAAAGANRRDQARALYEWVSKHIRYVAIYLNRGGIEPHAAATVLANGYGDCKDHVVLLAALLKAKGIDSRAVLLNLGNAYTLSGPPTMAQLNHVLTYIPEFDLYANSTLGVAPFGTLLHFEYGKPVVMVGADPALRRLPMPPSDAFELQTTTDANLAEDGRITGTTITRGTGPAAIVARFLARAVQSRGDGAADLAERQLASIGEVGTGRFMPPDADSLGGTATLAGQFTLEPQPGLLEGDAFAPPRGLALFVPPGDLLLGPANSLSLSEDEPTPCFPGHQIEELLLLLPAGHAPAKLPPDRAVENAAFAYHSHWTLHDNVLTVRRELNSNIATPLCEGASRHEAVAAMRLIRRDRQAMVTLEAATKPGE